MTRKYEVVYIFASAVEEEVIDQHLERFADLLKTDAAPDPVETVSKWGRRTLAYPIKNNETGNYVVANVTVEPSVIPEFERVLKLNPDLLRYLIVLNEGEAPRPSVDESDEKKDSNAEKPEAVAAKEESE